MIKINGVLQAPMSFYLPWHAPVSEIWTYARIITGRLHDDQLVNWTIEVHFNDIAARGNGGNNTAPSSGAWERWFLVPSCPVLSCPDLSCHVVSCLVLTCLVLSCPVLSCLALAFQAKDFAIKINGVLQTPMSFHLPWHTPVSEIWTYARIITGCLHDDLLANWAIEVHFNDVTDHGNDGNNDDNESSDGDESSSEQDTEPPVRVGGLVCWVVRAFAGF